VSPIEITPELIRAVADHVSESVDESGEAAHAAAATLREFAKGVPFGKKIDALVDTLAQLYHNTMMLKRIHVGFPHELSWNGLSDIEREISRASMRTVLDRLVAEPATLPTGAIVLTPEALKRMRSLAGYVNVALDPSHPASGDALWLDAYVRNRRR
jgi:hypothetical protein